MTRFARGSIEASTCMADSGATRAWRRSSSSRADSPSKQALHFRVLHLAQCTHVSCSELTQLEIMQRPTAVFSVEPEAPVVIESRALGALAYIRASIESSS